MIIHQYKDGSKGYQYEVGDTVIVERTIPGGWFDIGPKNSKSCTVRKISKKDNWRVATYFINFSFSWGLAECFQWMLQPTQDTLEKAKTIYVID